MRIIFGFKKIFCGPQSIRTKNSTRKFAVWGTRNFAGREVSGAVSTVKIADADGNNKARLTQAVSISTGFWSPDDSRILFFTEEPGIEARLYLANPDGSGLHSLKWKSATTPQALGWAADQKSVFVTAVEKGAKTGSIWWESVEGSESEKLSDGCGCAFDASPDGKYLLTLISGDDKIGIYALSLADHSGTLLVPGTCCCSTQSRISTDEARVRTCCCAGTLTDAHKGPLPSAILF